MPGIFAIFLVELFAPEILLKFLVCVIILGVLATILLHGMIRKRNISITHFISGGSIRTKQDNPRTRSTQEVIMRVSRRRHLRRTLSAHKYEQLYGK